MKNFSLCIKIHNGQNLSKVQRIDEMALNKLCRIFLSVPFSELNSTESSLLAVTAAADEESDLNSQSPSKLSKTENNVNGARIPTCSLDLHSHNSVVTVRALLKSTRAQDEGDTFSPIHHSAVLLETLTLFTFATSEVNRQ